VIASHPTLTGPVLLRLRTEPEGDKEPAGFGIHRMTVRPSCTDMASSLGW
jgi:hypothetical protein